MACRNVRPIAEAAREEKRAFSYGAQGEPVVDRRSGLFGDLKLDRPTRFLLDHGGAVRHSATSAHIVDAQPHEIATPQLAIDGQIEKREVAFTSLKLEPDADRPDLLRLERTFLPNEAVLIPGNFGKADERGERGVHGCLLDPTAPAAAQAIHWPV